MSVVIPTRNRLPYLIESVESVRRQTVSDWDLVVVDDASSDGTDAWLEAIHDRRVRVVRLTEHSERSAARNAGLAEAQGEFALFLDDDDRLHPAGLERMLAPFASKPAAVVATTGGAVAFDEAGHRRRRIQFPLPLALNVWTEVIFGFSPGEPSRSCFRRSDLERAGGWSDTVTFSEDDELWLRIARLGPVAFVPRCVVEMRVHRDQHRPPNAEDLRTALRGDYVSTLSDTEARTARRVLDARERWLAGMDQSGKGQFREAAAEFVDALDAFPRLWRSPVIGPGIAYRLARTHAYASLGAAGPTLRNSGAGLKSALRRAAKRLPSR